MILAKIDEERMLGLVRHAPLIAFQRLEFGYAVAVPGEAYYAPVSHPGGGNLNNDNNKQLGGGFELRLGHAFITRMSTPALRTLRPTAKPIPTLQLIEFLRAVFGESPEPMSNYDKAAGDHRLVVESETQVVIQAIQEHARPDLKDAMRPGKRDMMSDCLDIVIQNAESARELCEVGEDKPQLIKMYILQASTAMKTALEMLLSP